VAIGGIELIDGLAVEWRDLCSAGLCNEPFRQPEWIAAYVNAFAAARTLVLVTARAGGRLRAVLPLVSERSHLHGIPVRKLRSAANVHSGRFDLICSGIDSPGAAAAIWGALRETPKWDVIELREVPAGGAANELLATASADGYATGRWQRSPAPYLSLPSPPAALDAALAHLSKQHRKRLRARSRELEASGTLRLRRIDEPTAFDLERFYQLEAAGWKGSRGTAIACRAATRRFYDIAASHATRFGYFRLYALEAGERLVAMEYGLARDGRYYGLKPAHDEALNRFSPGHLLVREIIRDALNQGLSEYDFMGETDSFKLRWCTAQRPMADLYVFRQGIAGRALHQWKFGLMKTARGLKHRVSQQRRGSDP
jgi:CelD/BcsL family acetyltransferase involved in cellulose biosynthesis